jgi:HD-like signal output (HDOD) protein
MTAAEVSLLHAHLERKLDRIGLETQPKVAARLLELVQDPKSEVRHYVQAIKTDWTLTGRLLRLANSAFYAQRSPVTTLDRALVILGLERTKAMSLGFYLVRAVPDSAGQKLSRAVWGESVFRAGLCASLARTLCPSLAAEAFIVGLMLDCGQPLMSRLIGDRYAAMRTEHDSPAKLFSAECTGLEFTHVDVATVLLKRWKMPALLTRPIAWHHTLPTAAPGQTPDPAAMLQRLAYYTGAVQLSPAGVPTQGTPLASIAGRLFEINSTDLGGVITKATAEYRATIGMFSDVADTVADLDAVADAVHLQIVELMDQQMSRALHAETRGGPQQLEVAGQHVKIEPGRDGDVIAIISGSDGGPIISCTVRPENDNADTLCSRLGLEDAKPDELDALMTAVRAMAA